MAPTPATTAFCTECGRPYPPDELVRFGNNLVCAECKPRFVQKMREGVAGSSTMIYGGFWRRFLALILDSVILAVVNFPIQMILGIFGLRSVQDTGVNFGVLGLIYVISIALQCTYFTYFWSQRGASPG
ncbi:MAG: RDD family protein, partial [Acidobacteriaceae bacterium]|nr:RDD family protein [Acidobacteriaceae bacterium]